MNGLITALAWLLIVLTFTGSYRIAHYLAEPAENSTAAAVYPTLIAATVTVAFIVIFDFIILLTGLAVILVPGYLIANPERRPHLPRVSDRMATIRTRASDRGHGLIGTVTTHLPRNNPDSDPVEGQAADSTRDQ